MKIFILSPRDSVIPVNDTQLRNMHKVGLVITEEMFEALEKEDEKKAIRKHPSARTRNPG
jgi:hypothetical protein